MKKNSHSEVNFFSRHAGYCTHRNNGKNARIGKKTCLYAFLRLPNAGKCNNDKERDVGMRFALCINKGVWIRKFTETKTITFMKGV